MSLDSFLGQEEGDQYLDIQKNKQVSAIQLKTRKDAIAHHSICTGRGNCLNGKEPHLHLYVGEQTWHENDWLILDEYPYLCSHWVFVKSFRKI